MGWWVPRFRSGTAAFHDVRLVGCRRLPGIRCRTSGRSTDRFSWYPRRPQCFRSGPRRHGQPPGGVRLVQPRSRSGGRWPGGWRQCVARRGRGRIWSVYWKDPTPCHPGRRALLVEDVRRLRVARLAGHLPRRRRVARPPNVLAHPGHRTTVASPAAEGRHTGGDELRDGRAWTGVALVSCEPRRLRRMLRPTRRSATIRLSSSLALWLLTRRRS